MLKIFENLWVKLAAVVLAALLWFHVATNKVYQEEMTLPLSQVILPGKLVLSEPAPESITVIISATGKKLLLSDWKRMGLKLIVDHNRPGRFKLPLDIKNLSLAKGEKVDLIEIVAPREVELSCDRQLEKRVPVISRLTAIPGEGFAVKAADSLNPSQVTVSGPYNQIVGLNVIYTREDTLDKIHSDISIRAALAHPGIYGMNILPDTVEISVAVMPVKSRTFSDMPVRLLKAPPEDDFEIVPARIEVRASGPPERIERLLASEVKVLADYSRLKNGMTIPLQVVLPDGISIIYQSRDSVKIIKK